jgi:hypothetical protein
MSVQSKLLSGLLAAALLGALPSAYAAKTDCDTLVELGSALDDIREGLSSGEDVDDSTYDDLGAVVESLQMVADNEGNAKLSAAVNRLENAYNNNDRDGYVRALGSVDQSFGTFYENECQ